MSNIKNIITEVEPTLADFAIYFEDDGLTEAGGNYNYNLFIVPQSRNHIGFNTTEYDRLTNEIESLLDAYAETIENKMYPTIESLLLDHNLILNATDSIKVEKFNRLLKTCIQQPTSPYANYPNNFKAHTEDMIAEYLTLKTETKWQVDDAHGYCQGDHVKVIYCKEHHPNGAKTYGEVWLGAAKEFIVTDIGENGEECDSCGGYIIADCQASNDEDYKRLVCEQAGIKKCETQLKMIDGSTTHTIYTYRTL